LRRKHEGKKREKGTALLVAILLCAIIGSAALGINAIALRQINISETYSNGLVAYYTAESGLEEGLLRYRFNKNIQIPTDNTTPGVPANVFRNFLDLTPMRTNKEDTGVPLGYTLVSRQQVYDLRVYNRANFYGEDLHSPLGVLDAQDLADPNYGSTNSFDKIVKDEEKDFAIAYPSDQIKNRIYLFWHWTASCASARALEVKLKIDQEQLTPTTQDEYTALFKDPSCSGSIANADTPIQITNGVYAPVAPPSDLKTKMNISALKIKSMSLKPIGGSGNADLVFGFAQGESTNVNNPALVFAPTTNINSIGYFAGATREIDAHIDRQNGSILDLFNYVIYKGGR